MFTQFAKLVLPAPPVSERLSKSKIIPEQARALAHALKHAVVKPLKKTMMPKKKSFDNNSSSEMKPIVVQTLSSPSPIHIDPIEPSSPPAKPPRQSDESIDIPTKPPRYFSLYGQNTDDDEGLIQQTDHVVKKVLNLVETFGTASTDDTDVTILRQRSPSIIETFVVDPIRVTVTSHAPVISQQFEQSIDVPLTITPATADESPPKEITKLADQLTATLFEDLNKQFENHDQFHPKTSTLPQSIVTTHLPASQSTSRPLLFVSLDSGLNVNKVLTPIVDIATTKVTIISPAPPEISSTTLSTINSDDEEEPLNSSSTLMPNSSLTSDRSKLFQNSSKESSIDSNDTNPYDNPSPQQHINTGSATPARSLISDYDNLHGSFGSLTDDTQTSPANFPLSTNTIDGFPLIPTTNSSSMSTIYETADGYSTSSTNTLTSPTYVSAVSTLNDDETTGSITPARRLNSDISDEDLVESYEIETPILTSVNPFRTSKGTLFYQQQHEYHRLGMSNVFSLTHTHTIGMGIFFSFLPSFSYHSIDLSVSRSISSIDTNYRSDRR